MAVPFSQTYPAIVMPKPLESFFNSILYSSFSGNVSGFPIGKEVASGAVNNDSDDCINTVVEGLTLALFRRFLTLGL